jgi:hypothetical protein
MIQLASQTNIIYEQLSSSSISKLCIKRLFFMSPEQYLEKFLTKVLKFIYFFLFYNLYFKF